MTQKVKSLIYFSCLLMTIALYTTLQQDNSIVQQEAIEKVSDAELNLSTDETALLIDLEE